MYYINCFFIYSCLGFILETLFTFIFGYNYNSGFLSGPITPLYGIGAILVMIISDKCFKNLHLPRWIETIIVFIIITIILSILEYIGGTLIELIFNKVFWDYSDYTLSIGKYICLEMSFIWGIISIIFIYLIKPILDNYIILIPKWATYLFLIWFIIDIIYTIIK